MKPYTMYYINVNTIQRKFKGGIKLLKGKKLLAIIASLIVTGSILTGCSKPKQEQPASTQAAAPKQNENVTITYAHGKDSTPATKAMLQAFQNKYPNIKVNDQELPSSSDQQHNTFVTSLSAGDDSIDIVRIDVIWPSEFASAGWLEPLDSRFTKEERAKFIPGTIEAVTYEGKVYAVPMYTDSGVLYYRKDIIPTPPKTWDELVTMSKENVGKEGTKYGYMFQGLQYEGLVCNAMEFIGSNGGAVLDGNKVTINTPQSIAGLQYMVDMIKKGVSPSGTTTYKEDESRIPFQQGEALFMRNWPNAWALLNAADSPVKGKVGIAPIPTGKDGKVGTPTLGGWNMTINKNSKHKDAAWTFIQFMTGEEGMKIQALEGSKLPARLALYDDKDIQAKNPAFKDIFAGLKNVKPRPVSPYYPQMSDSMQINFQKALTGSLTAEQAIQNVEKELNNIIKSGGKK